MEPKECCCMPDPSNEERNRKIGLILSYLVNTAFPDRLPTCMEVTYYLEDMQYFIKNAAMNHGLHETIALNL